MRRFDVTDEEHNAIAKERFHHPNPCVQRRMEILWLKRHGETHQRIAKLAGVSRRTVQRGAVTPLEGIMRLWRTTRC